MNPISTHLEFLKKIQRNAGHVQLGRNQLNALADSINEVLDVLEREHSSGNLQEDRTALWLKSLHASVVRRLLTSTSHLMVPLA